MTCCLLVADFCLNRQFQTFLPVGTILTQADQPVKLAISRNAFQALKRVSGRLSRFLHARKENVVSPRRLLIVDDEKAICFSMSEYFTHHGFTVDTANDVEQAKRLIAATNYEVLIQDLRLGTAMDTDGLEVLRFVHERSPETRIIVLTAYGSSEMEIEAKHSGADAFLKKPQPLSQVAQVVRGLIESPRRWATPRV